MKRKTLEETKFWKYLLRTEKALIIFCSVITVLLIGASVFMRYILKKNFYGNEEIIILFAFWLYFLGGAYGSFENTHIKADIAQVYIKNKRVKDSVSLIASMVTVLVNIVFVKWSYEYVAWDFIKMPLTTGLKIPLIIPHAAILVGMALMLFYHTYYLIRDFKLYFSGEPE